MQGKTRRFSNFNRSLSANSLCYRPNNEKQLVTLIEKLHSAKRLARGNGLSYSDCCLNDNHVLIDMSQFNHLLAFDESSGLLICQAGVTFMDLLTLHPDYIPPVIPGTVGATLAGAIANDVHGKNNPQAGTFGHHIEWIELLCNRRKIRCSREENSALFYATIGGLGLTGIITSLCLRMRRSSPFVEVHTEKHAHFASLLERMQHNALQCDYQAAWLDLLHQPRAIYTFAHHCQQEKALKLHKRHVPRLPTRLIYCWNINWFNRYFYHFSSCQTTIKHLYHFNNPLDSLHNWSRLYGKQGFVQFQAVFPVFRAHEVLQSLIGLIRQHDATPTLAVLKYFTQPGVGLLSFAAPGFTLAIDFINDKKAQSAIIAMNTLITNEGGKIYLAKDHFLNMEMFQHQYPLHEKFTSIIQQLDVNTNSDLAKRLGLV